MIDVLALWVRPKIETVYRLDNTMNESLTKRKTTGLISNKNYVLGTDMMAIRMTDLASKSPTNSRDRLDCFC